MTLLQYLTSSKLDSSTWCGTHEAFILHWIEQVRLYHSLATPSEHLLQATQRVLLENAVWDVPHLAQVKNTSQLLQAQTNQPVTFDSYITLLESATQQFDRSSASITTSKSKGKTRSVLQHTFDYTPSDGPDPNLSFDVNMDIGQYQAFYASRPHNRPRLPNA